MLQIPENLTDSLYWLKSQTEVSFREYPRRQVAGGGYQCWLPGTHWVGLSENEIIGVEAQYGVQFTPDHREFLRVLHTLNQPSSYEGDNEAASASHPGLFYNWLTEETEIQERLVRPYSDLQLSWLPVWGAQPATEKARATEFAQQFSLAPALVPLTGHRYLVSKPQQPGNPVLSIWGDDIIVYGWNLRSYLLHELSNYLTVREGGPEWAAIFQADQAAALTRRIPFYEDYIQTWNGWPPRATTSGYGPILTS